jgi:hypothetical protein
LGGASRFGFGASERRQRVCGKLGGKLAHACSGGFSFVAGGREDASPRGVQVVLDGVEGAV